MDRKKIDLIGQRFGYLTVISEAGRNKHKKIMWKCKCDCGNEVIIVGNDMKNDRIQSCGCYKKKKLTKHGQCKNPIYKIWVGMMNRCYNSKYHDYKHYGARGIKVYRKWWKFENFYKDMGDRSKGLTLERIDNNDDYKPSNCKWATWKEQQQNRRAKGYCWNKKTQKWDVRIQVNYKVIHLGLFDKEEDARQAYLDAKKKYHKN